MTGQIFSIGYGNRMFDNFVALIQEHNIQYLIDVRSKPYSRNPDFTRSRLNLLLKSKNITYVFMGDTLGGRPLSDEHYDSHGRISYERMSKTAHYRKGIGRLRKALALDLRIVIMCSEGKPEDCHRSKLIGETLKSLSIDVAHIDERGTLISQNDVIRRIDPELLQPNLFSPDTSKLTSRGIYRNPTDTGIK